MSDDRMSKEGAKEAELGETSSNVEAGSCGGKIKLMEAVGQSIGCTIKNLYPLLLNSVQDDMALLVKKWESRQALKSLKFLIL
ncbi:hypothetical protein NDU88_002182 [Pleurodeles waltl]|uniref:Uncharacterized protein n=1 Tax=Pleurodeles waltl TaxID=8319 RepID=A0AAV7LF89_PLEWA|nr:hypothetical protein NDU88_002182 [Pleurodeles waltl]